MLVYAGTRVAVSTSPDANLPAKLPSVIHPAVDRASATSGHALASRLANFVVTSFAGPLKTFYVHPSTYGDPVECSINSVLGLRSLSSPSVLDYHPGSSVALPDKVASKEKAVSCDSFPQARKQTFIFDKLKFRHLLSAGVVLQSSTLRSKSFAAAGSYVARQPQRAALPERLFCNPYNEEVLLIILRAFKPGNPNSNS